MKNRFELKFDPLQGDYVVVKGQSEEENFSKNRKFSKNWQNFGKKQQKNANFLKMQSYEPGFGYISTLESNFKIMQNSGDENAQNDEIYPQPITIGDVTSLLKALFLDVKKLNLIYRQILSINENYSNYFNQFLQENASILSVLLNISSLFDEKIDIEENSMPNFENVGSGTRAAIDIIDDALEITSRLMKIVDIDEVNREINIILSTLNLQRNRLLSLSEI